MSGGGLERLIAFVISKNNQNNSIITTKVPYILVYWKNFISSPNAESDLAFVSDKTSRFGDK